VPASSLPPQVAAVIDMLHRLRAPWAVAGGWAIDLALGRVTRPHADVDVAVLRRDQGALRAALPGWRFQFVRSGALVDWAAEQWLEHPVHEVHARSPDGTARVELLLDECEGIEWVYRRDAAVRMPIGRAFRPGPDGIRLLAPEIVLLYKSKAPRREDEHDFAHGRELLDDEARAWLRAALVGQAPAHPWATALAAGA
jgi:hypothetical protein